MILKKQTIIDTYKSVFERFPNDAIRLAEVHKITGANMDCITAIIKEYQEQFEPA